MTQQRRITAADVARESGVSRTTVSFVLNGTPHQVIPAHTRERVLAAADRLGYTPHGAARSLRVGRSDLVLFYIPAVPIGPSLSRQIELLGSLLHEEGLSLITYVAPDAGPSGLAELLRSTTPAALIGITGLSSEDAEVLRRARIPVLVPQFEGAQSNEGLHGTVQERIGRLQVQHLAVRGHRVLAYAQPEDPGPLAGFADARLEGSRRECLDLGLDLPRARQVSSTIESGCAALDAWLSGPQAVTGVCCYNDEVAFVILGAAAKLDVAVPGDLAVVGVDNIPLAAVATPPLTTIFLEPLAINQQLVAGALAAIRGEPVEERPRTDLIRLIDRESV